MVTLKELQKQIAFEKAKRKKVEVKVLEQRKIQDLQDELKQLRRTPSQVRTSKLVKRTGRGLKLIGKKVSAAAIRQGKRIRKQQLRDLAAAEKREKGLKKASERVKIVTITKRKGKKPLKTVTFKTKKRKAKKGTQAPGEDFFGGIAGFGFGN